MSGDGKLDKTACGVVPEPNKAYLGRCIYGHLNGRQFLIVAATDDDISEFWSCIIPDRVANLRMVQDVAVFSRAYTVLKSTPTLIGPPSPTAGPDDGQGG